MCGILTLPSCQSNSGLCYPSWDTPGLQHAALENAAGYYFRNYKPRLGCSSLPFLLSCCCGCCPQPSTIQLWSLTASGGSQTSSMANRNCPAVLSSKTENICRRWQPEHQSVFYVFPPGTRKGEWSSRSLYLEDVQAKPRQEGKMCIPRHQTG